MTAASVKKPAGRAGKGSGNCISSNNITNIANNVKLPEWIIEKLAKIAARTDIWQLEQEEIAILAAEIRNFPESAKILSADFRQKVQAEKPRELEPIERAAIIIIAWDWRDVADIYRNCSLMEKVTARLDALAFVLRKEAET
ncbi:MAG: hypothetical protein KBB90_01410 [Spirochaetia bacterium]|jgi:hypothetical protein|nr:hypothetical protein [Spirochaetia bacterium]NLH89311.1 hypothetical protein [Treponema sp.]HOE98382.1 hypothetical protein [Rectinema sp.]HOV95037.1 hypothetical protein [Spirochaetales bacterium]HOR90761.1 hypothetical protein [Rectinema sp.]